MPKQLRHKGKFIKKKNLAKKLSFVSEMKKAKEKKSELKEKSTNKDTNPNLEGRRIVEYSELGKNLKCYKCRQVLCLENIEREQLLGLNSKLWVRCENCSCVTQVMTGKVHDGDSKLSDVNSKVVLGALHAGVGHTALNKILACLNIPQISDTLFKRYEREVGPAIEKAAAESYKRASQEERQLIIENIDKLCDEFNNNCSLSVNFDCHQFNEKTTSMRCNSSRNVTKVFLFEDEYFTKNPSDNKHILSWLVLERPIDSVDAKPIELKYAGQEMNSDDCIITKYYSHVLNNFLLDAHYNVTVESKKISKLETFDVNTLYQNSASNGIYRVDIYSFKHLDRLEEKTFYDFFTRKTNPVGENVINVDNMEIKFEYLEDSVGAPIFCTSKDNPKEYLQDGVIIRAIRLKFAGDENYRYLHYYVKVGSW